MNYKFLYLINILLILINKITSDEILGCGGFVKSHADIDFSKVEIKLLNKQGNLKDKTDCSPSNGYYFLPIYDKGEYTLKISPPPGWSFEPEYIEINFNGKSDICSQGKDVNFIFKGFGITGRIEIVNQLNGGPKNVQIELRSIDNGQNVRTTVTDLNGIFSFTPVIPGKYIIKCSHERWHFEKAEQTIIVQTGNTEFPKNSFVIIGFDVIGKIMNDGQSLNNIGLLVFGKKGVPKTSKCNRNIDKDILERYMKQPHSHLEYETIPMCLTQPSSKTGEYQFNAIAPGKYLIETYVQRQDIKLHIKPESIEFEVVRDIVQIDKQFEVTGFTVGGRVLSHSLNGYGIANANIKLNGKFITRTGEDGSYSLTNIKSGTYNIQVEADYLEFTELPIKISLATPQLPNILVSKFKVCGTIVSQKSYRLVIDKEDTVNDQQSSTSFSKTIESSADTGEWCTYLSIGKYSASVLTTDADRMAGIQFYPIKQQFEVLSSPISGLIFSQLRATLNGKIIVKSDQHFQYNVLIQLKPIDANGNLNGQIVTQPVKDLKYSFRNVLPGLYETSILAENLCWETKQFKLNVKNTIETIPDFIFTGYLVTFLSSHNVLLKYRPRDQLEIDYIDQELIAGSNEFCVPLLNYEYNIVSCHRYDHQEVTNQFISGTGIPITLNAIEHQNKVFIYVKSMGQKNNQFYLLINEKEKIDQHQLIEMKDDSSSTSIFEYDFYLRFNEIKQIKPFSSTLLFKPDHIEVIGGNDCNKMIAQIQATEGLIINGKIQPPINDVLITLTFPNNPEINNVIEQLSDKNGKFHFGPLDSSLSVKLTATKESYIFSNYDEITNIFYAHKLCEIIVTVQDESGMNLSGVLLSLSGAESYRKNLVTSDTGRINFHSLSPTQYFLRPMMKEYKFEPVSRMIDIQDGETVNVQLMGKRVAYSIFGKITSLNGQPFSNIAIEAVSMLESCNYHQEESITESNGNYRIRGLQPNCQYNVHIKPDDQRLIERTIPDERIITIYQSDIHDINIIGISLPLFVDVIVHVQASHNDYYKTLRLQMYKKGMADSPIYSQRIESPLNSKSVQNPGCMVFPPRIPFDPKTIYHLELTTTLSDKNYKYQLPIYTFLANRTTIFIEIPFEPDIRMAEQELNQNSISALFLIGVVGVIFFKKDLAKDILQIVWSRLNEQYEQFMNKSKKKTGGAGGGVGVGNSGSGGGGGGSTSLGDINEDEIERLAQSINATKRSRNVRKIN